VSREAGAIQADLELARHVLGYEPGLAVELKPGQPPPTHDEIIP
jgi:hypothetical protein